METETGKIQKKRYDTEGLRYELIENGRQTSFVYHNGELLHEKGEESEAKKKCAPGKEILDISFNPNALKEKIRRQFILRCTNTKFSNT